MKTIHILLLLALSLSVSAQIPSVKLTPEEATRIAQMPPPLNLGPVVIHDTVQVSTIVRKDKAMICGLMAGGTAISILIYSNLNPKDYTGRIWHGTISLFSISSAVACVAYSNPKHSVSNGLFALAGIMDGFHEELTHHYLQVKERMPYLNDQFWDPAISWQNKYTSHVPFAKTLLVGTTDGYHATRTANKLLIISGVLTLDNCQPFKKKIRQLLIRSVVYTVAKGATHYYFQN